MEGKRSKYVREMMKKLAKLEKKAGASAVERPTNLDNHSMTNDRQIIHHGARKDAHYFSDQPERMFFELNKFYFLSPRYSTRIQPTFHSPSSPFLSLSRIFDLCDNKLLFPQTFFLPQFLFAILLFCVSAFNLVLLFDVYVL